MEQLIIKNGKGRSRLRMKARNYARIVQYFRDNPDAIKTDCARDLGLTLQTVINHTKEIARRQAAGEPIDG